MWSSSSPEHEAEVVDACVARRGDDDRAVGTLRRLHLLEASVDANRRAERAVDDDAAGVAREPAREAERVGASRAQFGSDHPPSVEA